MFDVNKLLDDALKETDSLGEGEVFLVKDLFKGYIWNRIPRKDRMLLSILFLNHVNKTDGSLQAIEKTSSRQQKYINMSKLFIETSFKQDNQIEV